LRIGGQRNFSFGFYRGLSRQDLVDLLVKRDWSFGKPSGFSSQTGLVLWENMGCYGFPLSYLERHRSSRWLDGKRNPSRMALVPAIRT
jgi:hypothetical protein